MSGPFLRFAGVPRPHDIVGWTGNWPPPERIAVAYGTVTNQYAYSEDIAHAKNIEARSDGTIQVTIYRLESYSKLDQDKLPDTIARGAQYVEDV